MNANEAPKANSSTFFEEVIHKKNERAFNETVESMPI
jgi:hypothetical protein